MLELWNAFKNGIVNTFNWEVKQILFDVPWNQNYFYGLIVISLFVMLLEVLFPWRKEQKFFRKDFWLDTSYMFLNFFVFYIFLNGFFEMFNLGFSKLGIEWREWSLIPVENQSKWWVILSYFILNDFVQWLTHWCLHRFDFLWRFHKVHHSVKEMGFAAHLRYHWAENVFYKPLKSLAIILLIGADPGQAFLVHFGTIIIGHLNHANLNWTYGPLKYLFNNPVMHLYHHAKVLPKGRLKGANFGISLSIWDYIFNTNYIPDEVDSNEELGFEKDEEFPQRFFGQFLSGWK